MSPTLNWNTLPDLIAISVLVTAFASLSRRRADDGLRLWLLAWSLIVVHFVANFCDGAGTNVVAQAVALWTLQGAGLAFMWGVVSYAIGRVGVSLFAAYAIPQLVCGGLSIWNVQQVAPHVFALALATFAPIIVGFATLSRLRHRITLLCSTFALTIPFALVLVFSSDPTADIIVCLAWLYFCSAYLYWRRFQRATVGVGTTVFGFITWGFVFPVSYAQGLWWPGIHVDDTAWNIPKYIVAFGLILTLLEEQIERSSHLARHDELTGLPNRRLFEERLERCIARARKSQSTFALLTIDLDRFKEINDGLGHRAGDDLLRAVALKLESRMRPLQTCSRYGGDEFTVIAEDATCRLDAERLARELTAALAEPVVLRGVTVVAAASVGIAMFPDDGLEADDLHAISDNEMYASKRMRRVSYARG